MLERLEGRKRRSGGNPVVSVDLDVVDVESVSLPAQEELLQLTASLQAAPSPALGATPALPKSNMEEIAEAVQ